MPLAVLGETDDVAAVVDQTARRLLTDLPRADARDMLSVAGVFLGLRVGTRLMVTIMGTFAELLEDSEVYQTWLRRGEARGRASEAQDLILRLGERRLGRPSVAVVERVRANNEPARLAAWADRLLTAEGWDALLQGDE